jgi:hypothetical protein
MTRQSLNIQFFVVAIFAIGASFATEVLPDSYEFSRVQGYYWLMPLGIALSRLFIVAYTSTLKKLYPDEEHKFEIWAWTVTGLIAVYILHLWQFSANPIKPAVHWSLQLLNVVLVGAEFYYGRLMLKTKEVMYEETLKDEIAAAENTIKEYWQELEELRPQIENHRQRIGSLESELDGYRTAKEFADLEIEGLRKEIEKAHASLTAHSKAIAIGQKVLAGELKGSAGKIVVCPNCHTPDFVGHRAKSKKCENCKTELI